MLIRGLFSWTDPFECRRLFDVDDGSGGGGDPSGDPSDDDPSSDDPKYTESQLQDIVQKRLKSVHRELKKRDQENQTLKQRLDDLEKTLKERSDGDPPEGKHPKDDAGKLEIERQKHQRELDGIRKDLKDAVDRAEKAETRQREVERDTILTSALSDARCIDIEAGRRYFLQQISWDEIDGQWVFTTKNGNTVEIADGISAELPSYLKPSSMNGGGSGTPSGGGRKAAVQRELDSEREKLTKAKEVFRKNPRDTKATLDYRNQKKTVEALERKLQESAK